MAYKRDKVLASAAKYTQKGQHDKAAREYQIVVDNEPQDIRTWLLLADALARSDQADAAVTRYIQVAKHYTKSKDAAKALSVYRQILAIDATRADIQLRCAELFMETRQTAEAVELFEKAAQHYMKQGVVNEALDLYKRVVELDPTSVARRLRLAELYSREKRHAEAVAQFGEACTQLLAARKLEDYVRVAERLLYHDPDSRAVLLQLVRAYLELNMPRRALVKLNGFLQESSDDAAGLELLAETFVRLGKVDKAVRVVAELCRAHAAKGDDATDEDRELAARALARGLEWAPNDPDLRSLQGDEPEPEPEPQADEIVDLGGRSMEAAVESDDMGLDFSDMSEPEPEPAEVEEIEEIEEIEELDDFEEFEEFEEIEEIEEFEEFEEVDEVEEFDDAQLQESNEFGDAALTPEVSEAQSPSIVTDASGVEFDVDKQLQEARVLAKYRLLDQAVAHLDGVLEQAPNHDRTLELKADVLLQLGRGTDAAATLVALANVLRPSRPDQAVATVKRAIECDPDNADATTLLRSWGPSDRPSRSGDDFAVTIAEDLEPEPEDDAPIEDRFGLDDDEDEPGEEETPPPSSAAGISDISEEIDEIEFYLAQGLLDDARQAFLQLEIKHAGHPALVALAEGFSEGEEEEEAAAAPLVDFSAGDDGDDDDYLSRIFTGGDDDAEDSAPKTVEHRARAEVDGGADPASHYDLGQAYSGMGLTADAIREFQKAAQDAAWASRSHVMIAGIHVQNGDLDAASAAYEAALTSSTNEDERSEANYGLGDLCERRGASEEAIEFFEAVADGFRDRDARLSKLGA